MDARNERALRSSAELDSALRLLDHELAALGLEQPIQVRAIGGYALMRHGVRSAGRAYTLDIDTLTRDYDAAVQEAIQVVAERTGLPPDWLNNDCLQSDDDLEMVEEQYGARWIPQGTGMGNVALSIATVPTLTRSKIIAADTAEFSGRSQDVPDLLDLLRHQGIRSTAQFLAAYPDPYGEYPAALDAVREHFDVGKRRRIERLKQDVGRRAGELEHDGWDAEEQY